MKRSKDGDTKHQHGSGKTTLIKPNSSRAQSDPEEVKCDIESIEHNLTTQEKWNIVSLIWREYNPDLQLYPKNVDQSMPI